MFLFGMQAAAVPLPPSSPFLLSHAHTSIIACCTTFRILWERGGCCLVMHSQSYIRLSALPPFPLSVTTRRKEDKGWVEIKSFSPYFPHPKKCLQENLNKIPTLSFPFPGARKKGIFRFSARFDFPFFLRLGTAGA